MKLSLAIAASLTLVALPVTAQKPAREFFYCVSTKIGEPAGYVGGPYQARGADPADIARRFRVWVQKEFAPAIPLGAGCYGFATRVAADNARAKRIATLAVDQAVVEVNWQYGKLPPATTATAQPVAAPSPATPLAAAPPALTTPSASNTPAPTAATHTGG